MIVGLEHNDFTFYSIRKNSSHLKLLMAHSILFPLARSLIHSVFVVQGCNCCGIGAVNYGRVTEPQPRSIMVAEAAQESKWGLFHQLGSHGEGRVPRPPV